MRAVQERSTRPVTAEQLDAYIEKVLRELYCPVFLRGKVRKRVYGFLCNETGLETALLQMPADQLQFRIGEPREAAQAFAATCGYVRLRGSMPTWKKRLIAAGAVILIVLAALFAVYVFDQWAYNRGFWGNNELPSVSRELNRRDCSFDPAHLFSGVTEWEIN